MHREEFEGLVSCAACGATIVSTTYRAYACGTSTVVCWDCAVTRGGRWDDSQERWAEPPRVSDLLADEAEPS